MLPRNVNLPPTLIKGEYNGFDGGIVFPEQETEKQSKLMKYPFVSNMAVNEKPEEKDPDMGDWAKETLRVGLKKVLKNNNAGSGTSDVSDFAKAMKAASAFSTITSNR